MAVIQILSGAESGRQYSIEQPRTVLGRHPECDIVFEIAAISRQHAQILRDGNSFFIEDLGSRNGTYVNGQAIDGKEPLREGDCVRICDLDFAFFMSAPNELLAGPKPTGRGGSSILLIDEAEPEQPATQTIMSTLDVSRPGTFLTARPETKLRAMIEISQSLGRALHLESVLPKLLDSLFRVFPQADRGFVVLRGPKGNALIPKAVRYRRPNSDDAVRISKTIVEKAMQGKEAILSADAASDERFNTSQSIVDFHIRSLMCAPLVNQEGQALGVLQIDTLDQRHRFTSEDLEVLASVANQAAIAIDNAHLHERAIAQESLRRDLAIAHQVQVGLLPAAPPSVEGYEFFDFYEAAHEVGGDYYDYVPLPGNRVAIVLGDVSGKGVSAALLMAKLSGEVRFCLASEADPAKAVMRINQTFARSGWADRFVTFAVVVLDPQEHRVTIVNAGHMPPILRSNDGKLEELGADQAGLPLGVLNDTVYESYQRTLAPGECVLLFTDGISEAMDQNRETYGLERIHEQFSRPGSGVADFGQKILEHVREFVGGEPQSDDMCIACFGRFL